MATAKKTAKKAVPKVVKMEVINLTKEQFQELSDIRFTLTTHIWELEDAFSRDQNLGQAAFGIGKTSLKLSETQSKLDKILDAIDPDTTDYWGNFQGDKNDN
jgi:hypothetical protein